MIKMEEKKIIYFISGHTDITEEDFNLHYRDRILNAVDEGATFVLGTAQGADTMAQKLLCELFKNDSKELDRITIYHRGDEPEVPLINDKIKTIGGYKSHTARDSAMTNDSDHDILWVRSIEECKILYGDKFNPKKISGTQQNLNRRIKLNKTKRML